MPTPLPLADRRRIELLQQRGLSPAASAGVLHLAERTVRTLCQRLRREGAVALEAAYQGRTAATPSRVLQQALLLHEAHPDWGAVYLLLRLRRAYPHQDDWPSARTLQRCFQRHASAQPPAPAGRKPATDPTTATAVHQRWQMDAVEQLRLQHGRQVSWLRQVDEFSGAVLGTVVFPPGQLRASAVAVQAAVRQQFACWGLPECFRVDNGIPWGNFNDLPTAFALWVVGLGVAWHWNDPGRPQQNPKIERSQGTAKRWCEPHTCGSVAELQARLDEADRLQRAAYPQAGGRSRLELFPQLRPSGRPYSLAWEQRSWSLPRVEEHLAEYIAVRRVGRNGNIGIYDRVRQVGRQYAGASVLVQYDPQAHGWPISAAQGRELRRHAAPEISRAQIAKMSFRHDAHAE